VVLIRIAEELEKLSVYAVGLEQQSILGASQIADEPMLVAEFPSPVLLTDNARMAEMSGGVRDALLALYASYPRTVEYGEVSTDWSPHLYPRVWCPSIDTIFFARTLKGYLGEEVAEVAEIGCGSGFLTKFILHHGPGVQRLAATDINLEAIRCSADNLQDERGREKVHLILPDASDESLALQGTYDLIASNPPYIPRQPAHIDNPYEGLDLVARLAHKAKMVLKDNGRILLNLSSLAGQEPLQWFSEQGLQVQALAEMRVPLKVNPVTSGLSLASRQWRDYLEAQGRVEIDEDEDSGYRYWHQLRMFCIQR
jgi:tRNA1(Val) A37 N6-methylase TrmN6